MLRLRRILSRVTSTNNSIDSRERDEKILWSQRDKEQNLASCLHLIETHSLHKGISAAFNINRIEKVKFKNPLSLSKVRLVT